MRTHRNSGGKRVIFNLTAPITTPATIQSLLSATQLGYALNLSLISVFIRPTDEFAVDTVDADDESQVWTFPAEQTSEFPLSHILDVKVVSNDGSDAAPFQLLLIGD